MRSLLDIQDAIRFLESTAIDDSLKKYNCVFSDKSPFVPYFLAGGVTCTFKMVDQNGCNKAMIVFYIDPISGHVYTELAEVLSRTITNVSFIKDAFQIESESCSAIITDWIGDDIATLINAALVEIGFVQMQ